MNQNALHSSGSRSRNDPDVLGHQGARAVHVTKHWAALDSLYQGCCTLQTRDRRLQARNAKSDQRDRSESDNDVKGRPKATTAKARCFALDIHLTARRLL